MKQSKRSILTLLVLSSILGAESASALDDQTWIQLPEVIERTKTLSLYTDHEAIVCDIGSAVDLAAFCLQLNQSSKNAGDHEKYNTARLNITGDIDLSAHIWVPISEEDSGSDWKGSIYGNDYTISGMHVGRAGNEYGGLIDTGAGSMTIKRLNFKDCTGVNNFHGSAIAVGWFHDNKGTLTVDSVSFTNCCVYGGTTYTSTGMLVGYFTDAKLQASNIRFTDCKFNGKMTGALVGRSGSGTIEAKNIYYYSHRGLDAMNGCGDYAGSIIGWCEANCNTTLDNVVVIGNSLKGYRYIGGIIGEVQGTCKINDSYVRLDTLRSNEQGPVGCLVGKTYGSNTTLSITNCTNVLPDLYFSKCANIVMGGALGQVGNSSSAWLNYVSIIHDQNVAKDFRQGTGQRINTYQGLLIGSNGGRSGNVHAFNCYVDDALASNMSESESLVNYAFGSEIVGSGNTLFVCTGLHGYTTILSGGHAAYRMAQANIDGARYTFCLGKDLLGYNAVGNADQRLDFMPIAEEKDGMMVRFYNKSGYVKSLTAVDCDQSVCRDGDDYFMARVGKSMTYRVEVPEDSWIVADKTTGIATEQYKRIDANTFEAVPVFSEHQQARDFEFVTAQIPYVNEYRVEYNAERQQVSLVWNVRNNDECRKYWGNDGYWQVLRNGTVIADSIPYGTTKFFDRTPELNAELEYSLRLVSDTLFFNRTPLGNYARSVKTEGSVQLTANLEAGTDGITISTMLPNSKHFDGCRVRLFRWKSEDASEGRSLRDLYADSRFVIDTGTYHYSPEDSKGNLECSLRDQSHDTPCSMYYYSILLDQFPEGAYADSVFYTNQCPWMPSSPLTLTEFVATKGVSTQKVSLTWKTRFKTSDVEVHYIISRKKYDSATASLTLASDTVGWVQLSEITNANTTNSYTDEAMPGYVYKYRLRAYTACESSIDYDIFADQRSDIGFTASRGTIMGTVSYSNGSTSVQGVDVRLTADSLSMTNKSSAAYARYFTGGEDLLLLAPGMGSSFWQSDWTLQFLLEPYASDTVTSLLTIPGHACLRLEDNQLSMAGQSMEVSLGTYNRLMLRHQNGKLQLGYADTPAETGADYGRWILTVSDEDMQSWMQADSLSASDQDGILFGATPVGKVKSFYGCLDEVRLWQVALSDQQIRTTYDRYLTGNESDLAAYYTFDSGVAEYAFDNSHPDGIWNNRHSQLTVISNGQVLPAVLGDSDHLPSDDILCYRGSTDANGEYQIAGIPYTGEGTNYMVVPVYGTHEFQPSSTRRYVSGQSLTHSNVNFSDVSSFPVDIQVRYATGDYPVKGVTVIIDNTVASRGGEDITTDANGRATVNVPVGRHRLSVQAMGHSFVNQGYPCSITEVREDGTVSFDPLQDVDDQTIDFQSATVAPMTFYDQTLVRLAGRVVGGNAESKKPLGFRQSRANIGQVELTLEPALKSGYLLNGSEDTLTISNTVAPDSLYLDSISSCMTIAPRSSTISIRTDSVTGEFLALLPPVSMKVVDIHTKNGKGSKGALLADDFGLPTQNNVIDFDLTKTASDTLYADTTGLTLSERAELDNRLFTYHAKKSYTYFVDPQISVTNPGNIDGLYPAMLGDSVWVNSYYIQDKAGALTEYADTVRLWSPSVRDGSSKSYLVQERPIFTQGRKYSFDIKLFEQYTNRDTGLDTLYYIPDVALNIRNSLATLKATVRQTEGEFKYELAVDSTATVQQSDTTDHYYEFIAGFPNPTAPHTGTFSISYTTNGHVYTYPDNDKGYLEGIVIGAVNVPGSDFITKGPDLVSFVLRDPPGSGSYSWLEQGSSLSSSWSFNNVASLNTANQFQYFLYNDKQSYTGTLDGVVITLDKVVETSKYSNTEVNATFSFSHNYTDSHKLTYTVADRLQTGTGDLYVGSYGDLYVGSSTNIIISRSQILGFRASSSGNIAGEKEKYELASYEGMSQSTEFPTMFIYSQRRILNELIPQWRQQRRAIATVVSDLNDTNQVRPLTSGETSRYYVLQTADDNNNDWKPDVDYKFLHSEPNATDSIQLCNASIQNWISAIRVNEQRKYETMKEYQGRTETYQDASASSYYKVPINYGFMGNVSLDAGATYNHSETREYVDSDDFSHAETYTAGIKAIINWAYFAIFAGTKVQHTTNTSASDQTKWSRSQSTTQKQTFGYVLADSKPGNYYSIDTYLPAAPQESGTISSVKNGERPSFDDFFVFRLIGGQSKCPYEGEEYSLYYKVNGDPVKLGDGTIPIEVPYIHFNKPTYTNEPNGQDVSVEVTVSNQSLATTKVPSNFDLLISNNPDGLEVYMDGTAIPTQGTAVQFCLLPGQSVTKTLKVHQTQLDVIDYNNLTFKFRSSGEVTRYALDSISIHFKPASSPIEFSQSTFVVNSQSPEAAATFTVSGYQPDFQKFAGVRIQCCSDLEPQWSTVYELVNDSALIVQNYGETRFPTHWQYLQKDRTTFSIPMSGMVDGQYHFRAVTYSINSPESEVTTESETLDLLKDTHRPDLLTMPTPTSGYYVGTEDIGVQFNEPIEPTMLTDSNFSVVGVLNDAEVRHMTGLHFEGSTPARTQSRVDIFGQSSALAFWYKPQVGQRSCLISQASTESDAAAPRFAIYYEPNGHLSLLLDGKTYTSSLSATSDGRLIDDWMYLVLCIDREENEVDLFNLFGTSTQAESHFISQTGILTSANTNVPLYVGGSISAADDCHADIEDLVLYDGAVSFTEAAAGKGNRHLDNIRGLLAYWPMDESTGLTAVDRVRHRNLVLQGTDNWYLPVTNYALRLNGENQYVRLNTSGCPISKDQDYELEFFFRASRREAQEDDSLQTLLSNGWGGPGSPEPNLTERFSISLDNAGRIVMQAAGYTHVLGSGYNDDQWHFLSLNVQRDAYATISVDTIDITGNTRVPGSYLGGLSNAYLTLGAMTWQSDSEESEFVSHFFAGDMDEVRLFNLCVNRSTVNRGSIMRLTPDVPGLVAYYPFEQPRTVAEQYVTRPCLGDCVSDDATTGYLHAASPRYYGYHPAGYDIEGQELSDEQLWDQQLCAQLLTDRGPRLRAAGIPQPVGIKWTDNGSDRITFRFPDAFDKSRVEDCVLTFTVKDVLDKAGNRMEQPVSWNVYIHQNRLSSSLLASNLTQETGGSTSTVLQIENLSASDQSWQLTGLPSWLNASQTSGTLSAFSSVSVDLTTSESASIGSHQGVIYVEGSDELTTALEVNLSVICHGPDWELADVDGSVWMSLFGRLKVDGLWSTDTNDIVGAFAPDGRCLGLASPVYNADMDTYYLTMNIKGNKADTLVQFRVWDAATGITYMDVDLDYWQSGKEVHATEQRLIDKAVLGNFTHPYCISTRDVIRQSISLHEGWNWISLWVNPTVGLRADSVFMSLSNVVTEIKARDCGYDYSDLSWVTMTLADCYHVYATAPAELLLEGTLVRPESVDITFLKPTIDGTTRWQWLGYPLSTTETLAEAFSDFMPTADDVIKDEYDFAMFNGRTWIGGLTYLTPGRGYLYGYHGANGDTGDINWNYPTKGSRRSAALATSEDFTLSVDPYDYEDYTFVRLNIVDLQGVLCDNYLVSAIGEDGLCHGLAQGNVFDGCKINIFGIPGETYSFLLLDQSTGQVYEFDETKAFDAQTPGQVLTLLLSGSDGIDCIQTDEAEGEWYTVSGVRVREHPQQRGVYIRRGEKQFKN